MPNVRCIFFACCTAGDESLAGWCTPVVPQTLPNVQCNMLVKDVHWTKFPERCSLNDAKYSLKDALCACCSEGDESLAGWCMPVAFALLVERHLGAESAHAPYLASLPTRADVPLFWGVEDRRELQGTDALEARVLQCLVYYAQTYSDRVKVGREPGAQNVIFV
jgi:hypothetical protein